MFNLYKYKFSKIHFYQFHLYISVGFTQKLVQVNFLELLPFGLCQIQRFHLVPIQRPDKEFKKFFPIEPTLELSR